MLLTKSILTHRIPINFRESDNSNILSSLPVDPTNNITYYYTYFPGGSFELTAQLTKARDSSMNDNGDSTLLYETGTPNHVATPIVRESSLIGYWKLDEGTGTVVKNYGIIGKSAEGTFNGTGTKWATVTGTGESIGVFNPSTTATNDHVITPAFAIPNIDGTLTISSWVNCTSQAYMQSIIGNWTGDDNTGYIFVFRREPSNNLEYEFVTGSANSKYTSSNIFLNYDNQWILITTVANYNSRNIKVYRNGTLFSNSGTIATPMIFPSTSRLEYIGKEPNNAAKMSGYIDDVRIYNRTLTEDEIMGLYGSRKAKYGL